MRWLSVKQFAEQVGLTVQGVHYLIKNKDARIKSDRFGHQHVIDEKSVKNFELPAKGKAKKALKRVA